MENTQDAKVALVTGASRGIGKACAIALAKAGYKVAVNYASNDAAAQATVAEIEAVGSEAIAIKADTSDLKAVQDMMRTVVKTYGKIDVLVNNAGICMDELVLMMNADTIDKCLDINIKGYLYCAQQAALKMFSKKKGCIINVSSVSSVFANEGQTVYSSTKGAVNAMTMTMAKELAPRGIRVNAVAPGFIATDMVDQIPEEIQEKNKAKIPVGRYGTPEEVADVVAMLASDACAYITGQVIVIDGGLSL